MEPLTTELAFIIDGQRVAVPATATYDYATETWTFTFDDAPLLKSGDSIIYPRMFEGSRFVFR